MIRVGTELFKIARRFQIPFLLNDRVDVALAVDADGVHIGQVILINTKEYGRIEMCMCVCVYRMICHLGLLESCWARTRL